ncbi:MAG: reprolysin-like metallopeptidase [Bacteroidota bacterium]
MKKILTTLLSTFFACCLFGQQVPNFWKQIGHDQVFLPEKSETVTFPNDYSIYSLDVDEMANYLRNAPAEGSEAAKAGAFQVMLPMPDGSMETFYAWESSVMHPDLAARFPMIKTYAGRSVDNPAHSTRFGLSPAGFHAVVPSKNGGAIMEPYATYQDRYYICYAHSGFLFENLGIPAIEFIKDQEADEIEGVMLTEDDNSTKRGGGDGELAVRKDYLFVFACTGEYGQIHGGDQATVLGTLVAALNAMNGLLERDIDVRFTMHPENDKVVFTSAANDPFINANVGGALLGQNQELIDQVIGVANYDVGHVYTGPCTDVGGVVSGTVCAQGKARGVTCNFSSNVIATTLSIAAHEIMHQFSGGHTFNYCPGNEGQFSSSSAWEPGSGSTILSYQGACPGNNIPGPATIQYHAGNIEEVWNYVTIFGGAVCAHLNTSTNYSPVVTENYEDGFSIPIRTPFELEVSATDQDGDDLTYSWEQMNRSPSAPLGEPFGDAPTFRVYDHNTSPLRYFPRLPSILNNNSELVEILPTFSKNLDFRCVVRDNNVTEGAGGVTWVDVAFKATESAGPFLVTYPNTSAVEWTAGEQVEITWDVANTDNDIVRCQSVDIYLSTNGGNTFDYLLLSNTFNDGSEVVTVPELVSNNVRVKIKAANNIFFDVSNSNFSIKPAQEPFYSLQIIPEFQRSCAPETNYAAIDMNAFAGYDQPVELAIIDGLPAGAAVDFSNNPVMPGESTEAIFDMNSVSDIGLYELTLQAISDNDTSYRKMYLEVVFNDFSAMVLSGPSNGESNLGLLPDFKWTDLPQADLYDFQLSTSPLFEPESIIIEEIDLSGSTYTPDFALEENTVYYWRIRPSNICGKGDFTLKNTFQTFNTDCTARESSDVPVSISAVGLPTVESQVTVLESGIISDVNIRDLEGVHDALADLRVSVVSPEETEVVLFENICGNVSTFNLNLNDESPFDIDCPPLGGFAYRPQEPLAAFNGENTLGNWTLRVEVINTLGAGGSIQGWTIEFCANITPKHPYLVENDTIYVRPDETRVIHNYELWAADEDNAAAELSVMIVDETKHGYIARDGDPLGVGDVFKFTDINSERITYTNTNPDEDYDFFTFTVTDGGGGLFGTPKFNIVITEDAVTDVDEAIQSNEMLLYPNPANDKLNVQFNAPLQNEATLVLTDVQGKVLGQQQIQQQTDLFRIDLEGLSDGVYFMTITSADGVMTEKFIVQQ